MDTEEKSLFVALVELRPVSGCELDPDEFVGAIVRCCVSAPSLESAINRFKDSFARNHFELVDMDWCVNDAKVDWEMPDDDEAEEMLAAARSSDDVAYSEFYAWQDEDE